jgi:hypothetical protein
MTMAIEGFIPRPAPEEEVRTAHDDAHALPADVAKRILSLSDKIAAKRKTDIDNLLKNEEKTVFVSQNQERNEQAEPHYKEIIFLGKSIPIDPKHESLMTHIHSKLADSTSITFEKVDRKNYEYEIVIRDTKTSKDLVRVPWVYGAYEWTIIEKLSQEIAQRDTPHIMKDPKTFSRAIIPYMDTIETLKGGQKVSVLEGVHFEGFHHDGLKRIMIRMIIDDIDIWWPKGYVTPKYLIDPNGFKNIPARWRALTHSIDDVNKMVIFPIDNAKNFGFSVLGNTLTIKEPDGSFNTYEYRK